MRIKSSVKKFTDVFYSRKICGNKRLTTSYVSAFLIVILLVTATASWFTVSDTAGIDSDTFTMESVSGLRVNDGEDLKNQIKLENIKLEEASSVDGRNMFFPTTGTFTSTTSEMKFREGNSGDRNVKYAYKDFTLKGDSALTYVYLKNYAVKVDRVKDDGTPVQEVFDGSTKITYTDGIPTGQEVHQECPIRMAFITDSCKTPVVLDPSALLNDYAKKYNAVDLIDESGKAYTKASDAESLSDYYFATGKPIFTLEGSTPLSVTMVVWLEGTSEACDQYAGQNISVDIELESNWTDMDFVKFVDDTLGDDGSVMHWINQNDSCFVVMTYKDTNAEGSMKSVVMQQSYGSKTEWYAPIPKNIITDISFYRYSLSNEIIYNAWHTRVGVNDQLNTTAKGWATEIMGTSGLQEYRTSDGTSTGTLEHTYTARRGNGYGEVTGGDYDSETQKKRLSPCIGYWGTPSGSQETTTVVSDTTAPQTTTQAVIPGDTVKIGIYLGQIKAWVQSNIETDGYKLYAELSDGNLIEMSGSDNYYKAENATVALNSTLNCFTLISDTDTKKLALTKPQLIVNNYNMSFTMNDDDTISRTG